MIKHFLNNVEKKEQGLQQIVFICSVNFNDIQRDKVLFAFSEKQINIIIISHSSFLLSTDIAIFFSLNVVLNEALS